MTTDSKTPGRRGSATADTARSFEERYGAAIVSRGIATVPALLLRWQSGLGLKDGHVVLLMTIFSFYRTAWVWPSVSIEKMAKWRGISRKRIEKEIGELEALVYLVRPEHDRKHGSYVFDLTGLMDRLGNLGYAEANLQDLRKAQAKVFEGAFPSLSMDGQANRGQEQSTRKENKN